MDVSFEVVSFFLLEIHSSSDIDSHPEIGLKTPQKLVSKNFYRTFDYRYEASKKK